ncbi:AAA family ATPase [Rhodopila sp.]|uniref:bifunctional aminoglycoside phosphotransferase/ATP-binding protein n=1 Tax=Rhodopila sp. TaxID=2480087 RepID=UPI003D1307C5
MTVPAAQRDVARFLSTLSGSPASETHISAVFVGGDTVWKLKKAVRLPFLDFTSIDARHHFLMRELELNKPAAPGIYRDIVAVVRTPDGTLAINAEGAAGAPVDWVLRMARVPEPDFLDVIAERGALTPKLLDALGDCVALYHARLPPISDWDSAAALLHTTHGNADAARAAELPAAEVEDWQRRIEAGLRTHGPWLNERAATGFVRRCHGDLHLGNLCLWQSEPVAFDALEFDEAMATTDVGYDLAFLLMDLDHRVDRAAANRVMNRYLARTGDVSAMRGLPLFLSERAMIRAHVSASSDRKDAIRPYLTAAHQYLSPPPALVLAIGGLQGSGKSTLARLLAPDLGAAPGAVVLRSDEIRKRLHEVSPEARLPPNAYSDKANAAVNAMLLDQARQVAEAGHVVILDATFIDPQMRRAAAAAARNASAPFVGVWLDVSLPELEKRVAARRDDASDATLAVLRQAAATHAKPRDWLKLDGKDMALAVTGTRQAIAARIAQPV